MERKSIILDAFERPIAKANGRRTDLLEALQSTERVASRSRRMSASYDAARDSQEYAKHWAPADPYDADTANRREVRHKLVTRSRYETFNNGYVAGPLCSYTNMLIGTGPQLRVNTDNIQFNRKIEQAFAMWSRRVKLQQKLWSGAHAKLMDGETFFVFYLDNDVPPTDVQTGVMLIETEQVQTPQLGYGAMQDPTYIDGIKFNESGNVEWYDILPEHPGSSLYTVNQEPIRTAPELVMHWFKATRPGQHRGIPALTPTLNCGADGRRLREAVIAANETAADISMVLKTAFQPDEMAALTPLSTMEFKKRMIMALPDGYEAQQMKGEFPNERYDSFMRNVLSEQVRPINMPYNVAAMDSSTYSFASGKLDTLTFRKELDIARFECNELVMNPIFDRFYAEYVLLEDSRRDATTTPPYTWNWPAHEVVDVQAEAEANDMKLRNGTTSLRRVLSEMGLDYDEEIRQQVEDYYGEATDANIADYRQRLLDKFHPSAAVAVAAPVADDEPIEDDDDEAAEDEEEGSEQ